MAEGLLRRRLDGRGVDGVRVESCGVAGWDDSPAMPEAVQAMSELEVDIGEHRARRLVGDMVEAADLVLAMAEEHAALVGRLAPHAASRTFTLKELVKLLDHIERPDGAGDDDERLRAAVATADERRSPGGTDTTDPDIADPLGLGLGAYRATAWELDQLIERLV